VRIGAGIFVYPACCPAIVMRVYQHLAAFSLAGLLALITGVHTGSAGSFGKQMNGGSVDIAVHDDASEIESLHPRMVESARALGLPLSTAAEARTDGFQYPLRPTKRATGFAEEYISNFVDHDSSSGVQDFACGTRTYDGHGGTDFVLFPYRWTLMKKRTMAVVAAQGGTILSTHDGEYDKNCSLADATANSVIISHDNGLIGYYWHLKKGSVIEAENGDRVEAGTVLGYVGSSGRSTAPHLHFQVRDSGYTTVDPWEGACNARDTDWAHQSPTIDTRIIRLATHDKQPPAPIAGCDDTDPGVRNTFDPGDRIWVAVYMRDQTADAAVPLAIYRPDGTRVASWTTGAPSSGIYQAAYYWASYTLPSNAPKGMWSVRSTLDGVTLRHAFRVGSGLRKTSIDAKLTSKATRKIRAGGKAKFYAKIKNTGKRKAVGCYVSPGRPIDAAFEFQEIRSRTKKAKRKAGESIVIPAKKARHVRLKFKAGYGFEAVNAEVPLHVACSNAKAAKYIPGKTAVTLSSK